MSTLALSMTKGWEIRIGDLVCGHRITPDGIELTTVWEVTEFGATEFAASGNFRWAYVRIHWRERDGLAPRERGEVQQVHLFDYQPYLVSAPPIYADYVVPDPRTRR